MNDHSMPLLNYLRAFNYFPLVLSDVIPFKRKYLYFLYVVGEGGIRFRYRSKEEEELSPPNT